MNRIEVSALCDELVKLIGPGPGTAPTELQRAEQITQSLSHLDAGIGNAARESIGWFRIWHSERKWMQYGDGQLRPILSASIQKIRVVASRAPDEVFSSAT
ncbi:MAG TPA: hypothetical protein VK629_07480 [Steroidobacteraceae bacterium]|nr:hypothetical protein [Steroidobacteraceae bacterium]